MGRRVRRKHGKRTGQHETGSPSGPKACGVRQAAAQEDVR